MYHLGGCALLNITACMDMNQTNQTFTDCSCSDGTYDNGSEIIEIKQCSSIEQIGERTVITTEVTMPYNFSFGDMIISPDGNEYQGLTTIYFRDVIVPIRADEGGNTTQTTEFDLPAATNQEGDFVIISVQIEDNPQARPKKPKLIMIRPN